MDTHSADPCPGDGVFKISAIIIAALNHEADVAMFGGIEIPAGKGLGGTGVDAFTAIAAPAVSRLARFQQGVG